MKVTCTIASETRLPFRKLSICDRRQEFQKLPNNPVLTGKVKDFLQNTSIMTQLVLDSPALLNFVATQSDTLDLLELHLREYIFNIHQKLIAIKTDIIELIIHEYSLT